MLSDMVQLAGAADSILMTQDRRRMAEQVFKNESFYRGLTSRFIQPFQGERSEDFQARTKPPANVTRRVVRTFISGVYGASPGVMRSFSSDRNGEIVKQILDQNNGLTLQTMNWQKRAELSGSCMVMPRFSQDRQRFFFNAFTADSVVPIMSAKDPSQMEALVITFNTEDFLEGDSSQRMKTIHEVWTPDEFAMFINGKVAKNPDGQDIHGENPFKEIPGALFRSDNDYEAILPEAPATEVVNMHETLLELLSTWAEVAKYQSFNVLFFRNPGAEALIASPRKWLTSNAPESDVKSVNFEADLKGFAEAIDTYYDKIADIGEVPTFSISSRGSGDISGVALKIKFQPHLEAVAMRQLLFKAAEDQLWRTTLKLAKIKAGMVIDESDEAMRVALDFPMVSIPRSVDEQVADDNHRLQLGLTSPSKLLNEQNPELGADKSRKEVEQNLQEQAELRSIRTGTPAQPPPPPSTPPASGIEA